MKTTLLLIACLMWASLAPKVGSAQASHGVFGYISALGPDGTARAHVGDVITSSIGVINMDDFFDTATITNVATTVHHGSGDYNSSNLVEQPSTLCSYLVWGQDTMTVMRQDSVRPDDGDVLLEDARLEGTDNFDGPDGTHVPESFTLVVGAQVQILRPCLRLSIVGVPRSRVSGLVMYSVTVTNCGNTDLANVMVFNVADGASTGVLGPTHLSAGQIITLNVTSLPSGQAPSLFVSGTDELGLEVNDSVPISPVVLAVRRTEGRIHLTWNAKPGHAYQVEYTTELTQGNWTPLTGPIIAASSSETASDDMGATERRFYRVAVLR